MLQKLFNPKWQLTSKSFLLSSFLVGFSFSPTAKIYRLELEFEESLLWKTSSIFKERIGQESNGAANQEKQIFSLCQILPLASSTRDLGTRLQHGRNYIRKITRCDGSHAAYIIRILSIQRTFHHKCRLLLLTKLCKFYVP